VRPSPPAVEPVPPRQRSGWLLALPVAVYAALAVVVFLPTAPWNGSTLPYCNCSDPAMTAAFLEWTPWALLHGHNPFFTTYQYFPTGANYATNTTMPVLGVLMSPVTLTLGPIATVNLLVRLALLTSATSAFFVLRRWARWTPAAFAGGLLYGFSPFMIAQGEVHLDLAFVPLVPVLLLLYDEILVRRRMGARRAGLLLGTVAALQYGTSSELLVDAAIVAAAATVLLAAANRHAVGAAAAHAVRAIGWAAVVFVPLVAYPVYMVLAGPEHLSGPVRLASRLTPLRADLASAVTPTTGQFLSLGHLGTIGAGFVTGNPAENAAYVGVPLLLVLGWLTVRYRHDARLCWAVGLAGVAYVLALGPSLTAGGHATGVPLPDQAFVHLPLLDSVITVRFFLFGYLFLALALAIGLDRLSADLRSGVGARRVAWHAPASALVAAVALFPLVPRLPYHGLATGNGPFESRAVPTFFTDGGETGIPPGSQVLVYPFSDPDPTAGVVNYPVLWQAAGGERFVLLDGDATRPASDGVGTERVPPLVPFTLEQVLLDAYFGLGASFGPTPLTTAQAPVLDAATVAAVRTALRSYRISTVVADLVGHDPALVVDTITTALQQPPERSGGVDVWYRVQQDLSGLHPTGPAR
jgi:hypothetical protein